MMGGNNDELIKKWENSLLGEVKKYGEYMLYK
jgi:hypothetical protein